jgi:hypothetical protein
LNMEAHLSRNVMLVFLWPDMFIVYSA